MSRTLKNKSFRKNKNVRSVHTRYKPSGIKQKKELKESLRLYKNPEHSNYSKEFESQADVDYEFEMHWESEDIRYFSALSEAWDSHTFSYQDRTRYSRLHDLSFIQGLMYSGNTNESVCVWKDD